MTWTKSTDMSVGTQYQSWVNRRSHSSSANYVRTYVGVQAQPRVYHLGACCSTFNYRPMTSTGDSARWRLAHMLDGDKFARTDAAYVLMALR